MYGCHGKQQDLCSHQVESRLSLPVSFFLAFCGILLQLYQWWFIVLRYTSSQPAYNMHFLFPQKGILLYLMQILHQRSLTVYLRWHLITQILLQGLKPYHSLLAIFPSLCLSSLHFLLPSFSIHLIPSRINLKLSPTGSAVIPGQKMTFSSYPGCLLSGDDFYTISSGLVILSLPFRHIYSAIHASLIMLPSHPESTAGYSGNYHR